MFRKAIFLLIIMIMIPPVAHAYSGSAESTIAITADTRQILYAENENKHLPMASTTKIMTALIALENGNLDEIVPVSVNAQNQEGSSIYLRTFDTVTLSEVLYGLMLNSGNDAAVAIAEKIGGNVENFVGMMNEKAMELGLSDTHFSNPSGLSDEDHYSSAYDMAILMSYAMENETFRQIVKTKEHQIKLKSATTYLRNHNKLLWRNDSCIGGKTGYTKAAGRCLVSCFEEEGKSIIEVTLSDSDDWQDHENLFEYSKEKVENVCITKKYDILTGKKINGRRINILAGEAINANLKNGHKRNLSCKLHIDDIQKPIKTGEVIGNADFFCGKYKIGTIPILSGGAIDGEKESFYSNLKYLLRKSMF